jgi:hypothetical protein
MEKPSATKNLRCGMKQYGFFTFHSVIIVCLILSYSKFKEMVFW